MRFFDFHIARRRERALLAHTSPMSETMPWSEETRERKAKTVLSGTHRVCSPEETLARIQPFLSSIGITRVADVTHLDDLGLPVIQAVRPNSRNLAVSQGKGITKALAAASALMEAIELWHAEEPLLPARWEEIGTLQPSLPYSLYDLNLSEQHLLHDALRLEWFPARILGNGEETYIPADYVRLNFTVQPTWLLPTFFVSSNGLASGNVQEEAILHGLYEVIERDTLARARAGTLQALPIDQHTIDGTASQHILECFRRAGATVSVYGLVGPTGIACFEVHLSSPSYATVMKGSGCHLDRDVALSRALTEAAQVRLAVSAGARDDIQHRAYTEIRQMRPPARPASTQVAVHFHTMPTYSNSTLNADLNLLVGRVGAVAPCPPLVVDLTRPDLNIPVVFVVVPQFRMVEEHS
jgi:YcaO-like protein with predicted kinase domain